jgi:hypothetical protein
VGYRATHCVPGTKVEITIRYAGHGRGPYDIRLNPNGETFVKPQAATREFLVHARELANEWWDKAIAERDKPRF